MLNCKKKYLGWWAGVEDINSKNFKSSLGMKDKLRKISRKLKKKIPRGEIRNKRYERLEGKEEGEN